MQQTTVHIINALRKEKRQKTKGRLYHRLMIDLTYNSNHIEGSHLTEEETRYIFETKSIGLLDRSVPVDDIIETVNHFRAIDFIIDTIREPLSENYIKAIHRILKENTMQSRDREFAVGDYKRLPNIVGDNPTCPPEKVAEEVSGLLDKYNSVTGLRSLDEILDFHVRFEKIHPFQDGNGRVGRLVMFKECLANEIVPFVIKDEMKMYYYRGLRNWPSIPGYLRDTCLSGQDYVVSVLDYLRIPYQALPEKEYTTLAHVVRNINQVFGGGPFEGGDILLSEDGTMIESISFYNPDGQLVTWSVENGLLDQKGNLHDEKGTFNLYSGEIQKNPDISSGIELA